MIQMQFATCFPRVNYVPCEVSTHPFLEEDSGDWVACEPGHPEVAGYSVWVRGVNPHRPDDFECISVYERDFLIRDFGGDIEASTAATAYAQQLVDQLNVPLCED